MIAEMDRRKQEQRARLERFAIERHVVAEEHADAEPGRDVEARAELEADPALPPTLTSGTDPRVDRILSGLLSGHVNRLAGLFRGENTLGVLPHLARFGQNGRSLHRRSRLALRPLL
jgi:hypothetical protein